MVDTIRIYIYICTYIEVSLHLSDIHAMAIYVKFLNSSPVVDPDSKLN